MSCRGEWTIYGPGWVMLGPRCPHCESQRRAWPHFIRWPKASRTGRGWFIP
jgi:hypothetical protein